MRVWLLVAVLWMSACHSHEDDKALIDLVEAVPAKAPWRDFAKPEWHFHARFPSEPQDLFRPFDSPVSQGTVHTVSYTTPGGSAFFVSVWELSLKPFISYPAEDMLSDNTDHDLKTFKATRDSLIDAPHPGLVGKEARFHGVADGVAFKGVSRTFVQEKPRVMWQATALTATFLPDGEVIDEFLAGFDPIPATTEPSTGGGHAGAKTP